MKIAIDGPAASGKSTLGEALARQLNYLYFDTGVMYRAITLAAIQRQIDLHDEIALTALAQQATIEVTPPSVNDGRQYTVWLDGVDVTWLLREPRIDVNVSIPSTYPGVREEMVRQQRWIADKGNVVMVGRDIGTVVLPDADLKIYLDATVEERAMRRHQESLRRGEISDYLSVLSAMRQRDLLDSSRESSPLQPALDAVIIDSTGRTSASIIAEVNQIIINRRAYVGMAASDSADDGDKTS
ncbi:MAG: (d)CMP kinase [Chloroflexi bacterium]|nr:(d)CMP kinase [Chloroflexota bacterium]